MKTFKKNPRKQLEKFSTIFTQLGLVLTLFIVFVSLEHETEKDLAFAYKPFDATEVVFTFEKEVIVEKKKKAKITSPKKKSVVKEIITPKVIPNNKVIETVLNIPINDTPDIVVTPTKKVPKAEKPTVETMSINNVQNTPIFKGCEGLSEEDNRKCFEKKIQQHVQRYFDSEIAQDLGLNSGKYKIYTQFVIDKSGVVSDVKIRAPHKRLEKETNKVVSKIPTFTPGKQNNKPVKVKYTLPITFKVE